MTDFRKEGRATCPGHTERSEFSRLLDPHVGALAYQAHVE